MRDMRDEPVFPLGRENPGDEMDAMAMDLVLLMVRAQQMARGGTALSMTVEAPPITEQEVWGWRN